MDSYQTRYPAPYGGRLTVSGQFVGTYSINSSGVTPTALRAYYMPVQIPYPLGIDQLAVHVLTAQASKNARLGVFALERGIIKDLIYSNLVSLAATGAQTVSAALSLAPGSYVFAYVSNGGSESVRKCTIDSPLLGYLAVTDTSQYTHYYDGKADIVLTDEPTVTLATGDIPHIFARLV